MALEGYGNTDDHADEHKDGGGDELDAADLAGAQGTDGQVLTSTGAAAAWESAGATGDVQAIQTATGVSGSTVDFTSFTKSDADAYLLVIDSITIDTKEVGMFMEVSQDGGSNWDTGSSDYKWAVGGAGQTDSVFESSDSDDKIRMTPAGGSGNAFGSGDEHALSGSWKLLAFGASGQYAQIVGTVGFDVGQSNPSAMNNNGYRDTSTSVDSFRLNLESGNFSGGDVRLYKVVN